MTAGAFADTITGVLAPVCDVDVGALQALGEALQSTGVAMAEADPPRPTTWTGDAAGAYQQWVLRWRADQDTVTSTVWAAARVLADLAHSTASAISRAARMQSDYNWARSAGDLAAVDRLRGEYTALADHQTQLEAGTAAQLRSLTAGLPGDARTPCRPDQAGAVGWTRQQLRDAARGVGDAAWDAGPGTAAVVLRWGGPIGWAGGYDWAAQAESDAKRWLDAWGEGRTDTLTDNIAYGGATIATAFIPGPSGKLGIAEWGGRTGARYLARLMGRGWHGPNGLHLTPTQVQAVAAFYNRALATEPAITAHMDGILRRVPGLSAVGRDFVLKDPESLARKVGANLQTNSRIKPVLAEINDSARYTFVADEERYTTAVNEAVAAISAHGYTPVKWRNAWQNSTYVGINSVWLDPATGQRFEVQFHTTGSYWAKEYTHSVYRIQRLLRPGSRGWLRLDAAQSQIFSSVPRPASLQEITDPTMRYSR